MIKEYHLSSEKREYIFSILIPSWNNLSLLKLCVNSIKKNSTYAHQIIIHINEGEDGTLEWVKSQPELSYTFSEENIGVCYALNALRSLVKTDYLSFINDDMYLLPQWDEHILRHIKSRKDDLFFYSSTVIEPKFTGNNCAIAPFDYGSSIDNFEEEKLLKEYRSLEKSDWTGSTWPPNVLPVRLWDLVGGYSTEFSPGMYSDPDFSMKLWRVGVRDFRGISESRAYHFMSKTVGRIKKNKGSKQFLVKYGMTSSTFMTFFLRRGSEYNGESKTPEMTAKFKRKLFKNKLKKFFQTLS
jgi:glycosyltransferase involved in cell wall biosynthesis